MANRASQFARRRFMTIHMDDDHATTSFREHRSTRMPAFVDQPADFDPHPFLDNLSVAIVAAGAVGFQMVHNIARLQVGRIGIVDPDTFSLSNINTQGILPDDVGKPKAIVAAQRAKSISPATHVQAFVGRLESLLDEELLDFDIVLISTDNLQAELEASRRCRALGTPLITAAVDGGTLNAQVKCYANATPTSPCIACGYSEAEWAFADSEALFQCHPDPTVAERNADVTSTPTMSVAGLSCIAANIATITLLRKVLGLGMPVDDTYVEFNGYMHEMVCLPLETNEQCPADHGVHKRSVVEGLICNASVNDLIQAVGLDNFTVASVETESNVEGNTVGATGPRPASEEKEVGHATGVEGKVFFDHTTVTPNVGDSGIAIGIDSHTYAALQYCLCDEPRLLGRFVRDGETLATCNACGAVPKVNPHAPKFVEFAGLQGQCTWPLRELGVTDARAVKVKSGAVVWLVEGCAKPQAALEEGVTESVDPSVLTNDGTTQVTVTEGANA